MNFTKLIKLICAGATIGACLLATGCEVNTTVNKQGDTIVNATSSKEAANTGLIIEDNGSVKSEKTGIDFTDYRASGDYSILVGNNTGKRLVAFMGTPTNQTLISGVQAGKSPFGLKKPLDLFSGNGDFILFLVTEDDYINATKDNGSVESLKNKPFARIYAVFNTNTKNATVYPISSIMEGACSIKVDNSDMPYNVELRQNGVNGEPIVYVTHGDIITFNVDADDYCLFPVFRKYDNTIKEIVTIYPKYKNGYAVRAKFSLTATSHPNGYLLDASEWKTSEIEYYPNAAYIEIDNKSNDGIEFFRGSEQLTTSFGEKYITRLEKRKFVVPMELISGSYTENPEFSSSIETSVYNVRGIHKSVYITGSQTTNFTFEAGKKYLVTVSSNPDQSSEYDIIVNATSEWTVTTVDANLQDNTEIKTKLQ